MRDIERITTIGELLRRPTERRPARKGGRRVPDTVSTSAGRTDAYTKPKTPEGDMQIDVRV